MTIPISTSAAAANGIATSQEMKKDHIVIFPFMAKGHTMPLVHFAAALSVHGLRVTLITTPANAPFLRRSLPLDRHPDVHLLLLPFPHCPPLPSGCESTDELPSFDLYPHFLGATTLLRRPFHHLLLQLMHSPSPPLCLISDFFFGWTLPSCRHLRLPRIVFHGMSAFSMAMCKSLWVHLPQLITTNIENPFHVPGTPPTLLLRRSDIPDTILNSTDPLDPATQFLSELGDSDVNSWGVLVNSFSDIDGDYVGLFESFYQKDARAWLVGPLSLLSESLLRESESEDENKCIQWLNRREPGSVVYVSFGTQAHVTDEQLDEVAQGLAESGFEFLWAVRSGTWSPSEGWDEQVAKRGKIVKWAPQSEVLRHMATAGFVSHCGWNSVLEAVSAGVPILAWPMIAEQQLNAKLVVEELGVGLRLGVGAEVGAGGMVRGEEVMEGVRELMAGEKGMRAREKAEELSRKAKSAVGEGGSSHRTLEELIEELRKSQSERNNENSVWGEITEGEMVAVETMQFEFDDGIQIA